MINHYGLGLPIKGSRTLGFITNAAKGSANFVTGEYLKDGVATDFATLFSFSRDSAAWLYVNNALNSYPINTPRFKNGLVIEKKSTNKLSQVSAANGWLTTYAENLLKYPNPYGGELRWFTYTDTGFKTLRLPSQPYVIDVPMTLSFVIRTDTNVQLTTSTGVGFALSNMNTLTNVFNYPEDYTSFKHEYINPDWVKVTVEFKSKTTTNSYGFQFINSVIDKGFGIAHIQLEDGKGTSPIITAATAVTREADLLSNKVVATTVEGDWDSTLNLAIVNGLLVHTGHGVIRSLMFN